MVRPTPRDWQAAGVELLEVTGLFSDDDLDRIVVLIGGTAHAHAQDLKTDVMNVAARLNADLYYSDRPTGPEKKAALKPIAASLVKLRQRFEQLDTDTVAKLKEVAGREPFDPQTEPKDFPFYGPMRYRLALQELRRLDDWTHTALGELPQGTKGRRPLDPARRAADDLMCIYQHYNKTPGGPTIGPFVKLLRAVMLPVFKERGRKRPQLEGIAKQLLY